MDIGDDFDPEWRRRRDYVEDASKQTPFKLMRPNPWDDRCNFHHYYKLASRTASFSPTTITMKSILGKESDQVCLQNFKQLMARPIPWCVILDMWFALEYEQPTCHGEEHLAVPLAMYEMSLTTILCTEPEIYRRLINADNDSDPDLGPRNWWEAINYLDPNFVNSPSRTVAQEHSIIQHFGRMQGAKAGQPFWSAAWSPNSPYQMVLEYGPND